MWFCFFSLRVCLGVWSDFTQSAWIRGSRDSHFVQDFHLFMIKWYRHREICLCHFHVCKSVVLAHTDLLDWVPVCFCPEPNVQNWRTAGGGEWRRVLSGNHVLHDEGRICKDIQIWTPMCAWRMQPVINKHFMKLLWQVRNTGGYTLFYFNFVLWQVLFMGILYVFIILLFCI